MRGIEEYLSHYSAPHSQNHILMMLSFCSCGYFADERGCIMHLRCMTFREHPPVKIAFGDGGCYIMHLRCMTLITQIVLCAVQKVNEKKENKMRKMYSAQI